MAIQTLLWAALGTSFPFAMTALGAAAVFFFSGEPKAKAQKVMLGFAAGVMTAASIWSLLIPAIEQAQTDSLLPGWIPAAAGILLGAAFLAILDALPLLLRQTEEKRQSLLLISAITLHNIPEGMAVGLACALAAQESGAILPALADRFSSGGFYGIHGILTGGLAGGGFNGALAGAAALAFGIGIQNFPEGAAVALPLLREGRGRAFLIGTLSGAVEPIFGVLAAGLAAASRPLMPWLLSFAAGAMLHVTVEELIPQAHSRAGTHGYLAGFLIMMALDVALG